MILIIFIPTTKENSAFLLSRVSYNGRDRGPSEGQSPQGYVAVLSPVVDGEDLSLNLGLRTDEQEPAPVFKTNHKIPLSENLRGRKYGKGRVTNTAE